MKYIHWGALVNVLYIYIFFSVEYKGLSKDKIQMHLQPSYLVNTAGLDSFTVDSSMVDIVLIYGKNIPTCPITGRMKQCFMKNACSTFCQCIFYLWHKRYNVYLYSLTGQVLESTFCHR